MIPNNSIYLAGEFIALKDNFEVFDPNTQKSYFSVGNAGIEHLNIAIDKADFAFKSWKNKTNLERSDFLNNFAKCMLNHKEELANILHKEQGKSFKEALAEIIYSSSYFSWFANINQSYCGSTIPSPIKNKRIYTTIEPIGICAAITPFNFPSAMIARKLAPALAAGCPMIIKPSSDTPLSALCFGYIADKINLPKGLISILSSNEENSKLIGREICENNKIRKLSFTGSTDTGKLLMQQSAKSLKKLSLELGGNAPFIVSNHVNIDNVVENAILNKYRNSGQTCVCANRFFIHENIMEEFLQKLKIALKDVSNGPLINQKALDKVANLVDKSIEQGATLYLGGQRLGGLKYASTILTQINSNMDIYQEEIFGPVCSIIGFNDIQDVVKQANDTQFGLAAYVFSNNINEIEYFNANLEYGMIGVNTGSFSSFSFPFGGIKHSGFGKEGSIHGIEEYTIIKAICLEFINC